MIIILTYVSRLYNLESWEEWLLIQSSIQIEKQSNRDILLHLKIFIISLDNRNLEDLQ